MDTNRRFQLHMITDGMKQADELRFIVEKAVRGGADVIQLRYKSAPAMDLYTLGKNLLPVLKEYGAKLLINDRVDVALALGASGVHLAGKSLPLDAVRSITDESIILGCSVHSVEEAKMAEAKGASYITFGHIFPTKSKPGIPPHGVDGLRSIVEAVSIPVLAIGGITADNVEEVLASGCAGIAVIGAIANEKDPESATRLLREKMDSVPHTPRFRLIFK